ncbi:MAG TPA: hypothetical protein VKI17_11270, partial [Gemmataceae bacterium]|nr:hypothetical protein [Gemmataceae bacterium]
EAIFQSLRKTSMRRGPGQKRPGASWVPTEFGYPDHVHSACLAGNGLKQRHNSPYDCFPWQQDNLSLR